MTRKRPHNDILVLSKAGQSLKMDTRDIEEIEYDISDKTVKQLQAICRDYHLHCSGKRQELLDRLQTFSDNRDGWLNMFEPLKARVHGAMTGMRAKSGLAKRMEKKFPKKAKVEYRPRKSGHDRTVSKAEMSDGKIKHNTAWADSVIDSFKFSAPLLNCNKSLDASVTPMPQQIPESVEHTTSDDSPEIPPVNHSSPGLPVEIDGRPGSELDRRIQGIVSS
ncbi:unnamed protein product [Somion occarium]|uniref:SAP domain-containing protein n=1 Tax=Somion occarium TaxID=3059160 RepID=A0ABP1CRP1_9APHY